MQEQALPVPEDIEERLEIPDMDAMRCERLQRNQQLMQSIAPGVAAEMMPPQLRQAWAPDEAAAIHIQRLVRGFLARRRYLQLLFERFEEEERQRMERALQQCREGELLVRNRQLWTEMDDDVTTRKNKRIRRECAAVTIQRAWRQHRRLTAAMSTSSSASSSPPDRQQQQPAGEPRPDDEEQLEVCSLVSDYSELTAQVRAHFTATGGRLVRREDLQIGNTQPAPDEASTRAPGTDEETEEGRARRLRKHNLLSLAVEFAQLKQVDQTALPFGLHRLAGEGEEEEVTTEEEEEATAVPMEEGSSDEPPLDDSDDDEEEEEEDGEEECELRPVTFSVLGQPERSSSEERQTDVDWSAFEADLQRARELQQAEEEESLRRAYRLERARVLESLTMAGRDLTSDTVSPGIPRRLLSSGRDPMSISDQDDSETDSNSGVNSWRRQHGRFGAAATAGRMTELTKPMQLCFINDISSDEDFASEPASGTLPRRMPPTAGADPSAAQVGPAGQRTDRVESLLQRQCQLQAEAKLALAQAQPMAKMQLELEKKTHSAPIVKQILSAVGSRGRELNETLLSSLNITQLQILVNDFRSQIEVLNRSLMDLLMERDDLHMEQDSKLLDVEDLTRRAQEIALKLQEEKRQQASPARSAKEKDRSGSAASRAQAKARSTTRAVTSRLAAFFKSSNLPSPATGVPT